MDNSADAVVIGGGIMGAATAHFLAKQQFGKVVLLEKSKLAAVSTGHSAAIVRTFYSNPLTLRLALRAREMFENAEQELGGDCEFRRTGYCCIFAEKAAATGEQLLAIERPAGYTLERRGEYGGSQDANQGLATAMPYGFGAMILVVILLFNAIRQPVIVYLTVLLALIGVVYGLIFTGTPMEFIAILAVLSLTGMLIKNAIVLIDETDSQIAEGKARMDAVADAAVSRVRPVSLGMLTTVLGVTPLIWDPFFKSLAVVIIFGLSFATVLTLIVVPVLYAIFFRIRQDEAAPRPHPEHGAGG